MRLEHGKSLKRQHRATVEAMIHDEGLLEELPDDVTGCILEYLYKPTAADRRDERSYKQFRRRPRNSIGRGEQFGRQGVQCEVASVAHV